MSQAQPLQDTWFGHPRPLARLFTTEMWERFGYYGMRALLILYLTKHFGFIDETAAGLYGAFTALVYLTPLIGGLLADRYLGYKRSVKFGAVLMSIGYLVLCFGGAKAKPYIQFNDQRYAIENREMENPDPNAEEQKLNQRVITADGQEFLISPQQTGSILLVSMDGDTSKNRELSAGSFRFDAERNMSWVYLMFLALTCVIIGNGFFKPNISTMVGKLYEQGDARRDAGFTIFYMGINLGSLISQFLCPIFQELIGFWAGFLLAAVGMLCAWALIQFDGGKLKGIGEPPPEYGMRTSMFVFIGALIAIPFIWFLLNNTSVNAESAAKLAREASGNLNIVTYFMGLPILGKILFALSFLAVFVIPIWSFAVGTKEEAQKMVVAIVLIVFSVVFWTLFEQAGSSLTLYAERNTDRSILGIVEMPAAQTQIFNPLFIVVFAPIFSAMWLAMARKRLEPSIPVKFAIGLMLVGFGFLVLVYGSNFRSADFKVGLLWLVLAYLLHSLGELCLSPVGLSMITKLSITRVVGLMMGVWFLSTAMAQYVAGIVAQFASVETVGGEVTDPGKALATYTSVFQTIGLWSIGFGVLLLLLSPVLKRMMHGVN